MPPKLYRVLTDCRYGDDKYKSGDIITLTLSARVERVALEDKGCLALVASPPIEALDGWAEVGQSLRRVLNIRTIADLLIVQTDVIAAALRADIDTVTAWKRQLRRYIE